MFASFQIGTAQETWNACNSNVTVIPTPAYDSTFVLSAPSRAALAKGMAAWTPSTSSGASYLVYTALLTQSGTDAPVATVLENTLGGTVVWSYLSTGSYIGTLTGAFTDNKTIVQYDPFAAFGSDGIVYCRRGTNDEVTVKTFFNEWAGDYPSPMNDLLEDTYIRILVYP